MAFFTDTAAPRGPGLLSRIGHALGAALTASLEAQARTRQFEAYNRLSDAELAERGLTRTDIARHVFRDRFYI